MNKNVKNRRKRSSSDGFSLVETAAVVVIASLLLIAALGLIKTHADRITLDTNQQRINAIQDALINYEKQNNRLPCPASFTAAQGTPAFGQPVSAVQPCPTGQPGTYTVNGRNGPTDPYGGGVALGRIIIGAVPVHVLGLPDSYVANAYGYRFSYAVTQTGTASPLNPFAGAIGVVDQTGASVLPSAGTALYVVVDHGKDGKGAYHDGSATAPTNCTGGLDQLNCSFEAAAAPAAANPFKFRSAPFNNNRNLPAASWFDDTIIFSKITPSACTVVASSTAGNGAAAGPGASSGYTLAGKDSGWGLGTGIGAFGFMFFIFGYTDDLEFAANPTGSYSSPSPTADAYCPAGFNVSTGGCRQTYGGQPYGADVKPDSHEQLIMPPLSHPIYKNGGQQGWECNGSSALNMFTQAYVVCCP